MKKLIKACYADQYAFASHFLRLAFGLLFLFVAIKKFRMGYGGFAESLLAKEGSLLAAEMPDKVLLIYGHLLPIVEFVVGAALLLGQKVREAYFAIGVIYLTFIFGQMYDLNTSKVGTEYMPTLVALALAVFSYEKSKKA